MVERNLIAGNREGFNFREQHRTTPTIEDRKERAVWNHDQLIRNNLLVLNRDAQIWGWFDMKDNRHWPAGTAEKGHVAAAAKPGDIAAAYGAKDGQGQPQGLTLESLRLRFENNIYFAGAGQGWFHWGVTWGRHENYPGLKEFQADLGLDTGGQVLDPGFADPLQGDFRLRAEVMARVNDAYPQGPVPGVQLGRQHQE